MRTFIQVLLAVVFLLRYHGYAEAPPAPPLGTDVAASPVPVKELPLSATPASSSQGLHDQHVRDAAQAFVVPERLIRAMIHVESSGNPDAISRKGAMGLMQLMPQTASTLAVTDPFDPRQNVLGGTRYLRFLLDAFDGDVTLALAAYNAGEDAVLRHRGIPPYRETREYLWKVARSYQTIVSGGPP
jgi:soluble lytic murein transglycosylase-like protein